MSEFYIYTPAGDRVGLVQYEESVQWLDNYQSPGEAKIQARITEENLNLLQIDNRIYNTDYTTAARISEVEVLEDLEEKSIIARAQMTAQMLDQRVVMATENITNIESGMYSVYSKNRRNLPIGIATARGYTDTTETEITWNSVLDAEMKLAEAHGFGFTVDFDPETGTQEFRVYKGTDRATMAGGNYVGYFGSDVGNIYDINFIDGVADWKNVAIVAGEGDGAARKVRIYSDASYQGEARRELYVDRRDLQSDYQIATPTGEIDSKGNPIYTYTEATYTTVQYNALLDTAGAEALAEWIKNFEIKVSVTQDNMAYGTDYFLGDRMPIKIPEYGINASAVILSVNTIYELAGKTISITLGQFQIG